MSESANTEINIFTWQGISSWAAESMLGEVLFFIFHGLFYKLSAVLTTQN